MILGNSEFLFFLLRFILGTLLLLQGVDKVFNVGLKKTSGTFRYELQHSIIPHFVINFGAYLTSYIELICGALLIPGLFTGYAMILVGIDLALVVAAMSLVRPMWDMQFVFPRLAILTTLLIMPEAWNVISADYIINQLVGN